MSFNQSENISVVLIMVPPQHRVRLLIFSLVETMTDATCYSTRYCVGVLSLFCSALDWNESYYTNMKTYTSTISGLLHHSCHHSNSPDGILGSAVNLDSLLKLKTRVLILPSAI